MGPPPPPSRGPEARPPDFTVPPAEDLRECPWWRPIRVAVAPAEAHDPLVERFLPALLDAFRAQGHSVEEQPAGAPDIVLARTGVPAGPGPLSERVGERERPLLLTVPAELPLDGRPPHIVTLVGIDESLGAHDHATAVHIGRVTMARLGSPKVVFVGGDRATGRVREASVCTLEGGHPTDPADRVDVVRDRLVTAACAREVGGDYDIVAAGLSADAWRRTAVPDALVKAGRRMDELGLLPAPKRVDSYVSPRLASLYERLLGIKGFSEGMLFAFDPETQTMMVTASGSWDVDKRALRRDEVVPVDVDGSGERLRVLSPPGAPPKGPSVETHEMLTLLRVVPRVRLGRTSAGGWGPDPDGKVEAPAVRAGIHAHIGVNATDPERVESLPANRRLFPYGFGCGTDLMHEVVRDVAARSEAVHDPADPRGVVRWPMLYHGDTLVELWRRDAPEHPLEGLLDLFIDGGISYRADHIEQPR